MHDEAGSKRAILGSDCGSGGGAKVPRLSVGTRTLSARELESAVSRRWRLQLVMFGFPALSHWANCCRTSGALSKASATLRVFRLAQEWDHQVVDAGADEGCAWDG